LPCFLQNYLWLRQQDEFNSITEQMMLAGQGIDVNDHG
jgi:hypothetical protein